MMLKIFFYRQVVFHETCSEIFNFVWKMESLRIFVAILRFRSFKYRIFTIKSVIQWDGWIFDRHAYISCVSKYCSKKWRLKKRNSLPSKTKTFLQLCCSAFSVNWRDFFSQCTIELHILFILFPFPKWDISVGLLYQNITIYNVLNIY